MKLLPRLLAIFFVATSPSALVVAQQGTQPSAIVPRLVSYSGHALDARGRPMSGVVGVTFAIYKQQEGGAALWVETQSVQVDLKGNYTAQLGATRNEGLPVELFNSMESRWLGAQISGQEEQPRMLLLSVPYALKAADSETLGGLPASAFMLAVPVTEGSSFAGAPAVTSISAAVPSPATVTGSGGVNFLPLWTGTSTLASSALFQSGTGSTAKVGINTTAPVSTLDVAGGETIRGTLSLPATGSATSSAGKNSQPQDFLASVFNSSTATVVVQKFRWQAEPANNNTASAAGTMNLLYASGSAAPAETGLKISNKGLLTFASGQTFPGTGKVTSVGLSAPSSDFSVTGSPVTGSGMLALNWTVAPTDSDTANAIVKRDTAGNFSVGTVNAQAIVANNASGGVGVIANSSSSAGVFAGSTTNAGIWATSSSGDGVFANTSSASAFAVYGQNKAVNGIGIYGSTTGSTGTGVLGYGNVGVQGTSASIDGSGAGVYALGRVGTSGLYASSDTDGWAVNAFNVGTGTGVLAGSAEGWAAWFNGNVQVDGNLSKNGGSFKIDHPLDPANKYLYHSFVESPDMMNIYNGNVTTNAAGDAVVTLPEWFETLNRDFRYQLTVLGQFAQAIVAGKVVDHRFTIKTDKPNVEVSWQVTGIRQDAWANAHRIPVEEIKPQKERGFYQHPELYGAPPEKSIMWARNPAAMKQWKEARTKSQAVGQKEASTKRFGSTRIEE